MTVNEDNKLISEMVALLAKAGISAQDCELAETYLNGQAGDEVLDQFERKDLMTISRQLVDEAKKITEQVKRSRTRKTCVRFFNVVYAIGHDTCRSLFWYNAFDREEAYELDKRMVVYIAIHIESPGCLFHDEYSCLLRMVQDKPENLLEVLPSLRKEGGFMRRQHWQRILAGNTKHPGKCRQRMRCLWRNTRRSYSETLTNGSQNRAVSHIRRPLPRSVKSARRELS